MGNKREVRSEAVHVLAADDRFSFSRSIPFSGGSSYVPKHNELEQKVMPHAHPIIANLAEEEVLQITTPNEFGMNANSPPASMPKLPLRSGKVLSHLLR